MKASVTTTIPVRNGQAYISQTLQSLARQTRKPDRVIVLDNWSTDSTEEIVKSFKELPIEFMRNETNLGTMGNFNRCLDFATESEYIHILHADDCILPRFYQEMTKQLADCDGRGMAWCLDERIDQKGRRLTLSGKSDGSIEVLERDEGLRRKAEIDNQAFAATLLKTNYQPTPARFPLEMLVFGDMAFWGLYAAHCNKLVKVNLPLAQYRWHPAVETGNVSGTIGFLIDDAWRTMHMIEELRQKRPGLVRRMKLKGLMAVRAGINAKRFRQLGKTEYAREIIQRARGFTGLALWLAGQAVVETRELLVFKLGGRPRHPQNIFS